MRKKAIIFVGKNEEAIKESMNYIMKYIKPDTISIYYSLDSKSVWEKIKKEYINLLKITETSEEEADFYDFLNMKYKFDTLLTETADEIIVDMTGASKEIFFALILSVSQNVFEKRHIVENKKILIKHTPYKKQTQILPISAYFFFLSQTKHKRKTITYTNILNEIANSREPISLSELTKRMGRKKQTIFIATKKMINQGWINSIKKGKEVFYFMDEYQKKLLKLVKEKTKRS
ncbi:MAG: helix-turn-helix domain-containing protein [Candidatus Anstonellales archaeon]